jgi:hypothetical protein
LDVIGLILRVTRDIGRDSTNTESN